MQNMGMFLSLIRGTLLFSAVERVVRGKESLGKELIANDLFFENKEATGLSLCLKVVEGRRRGPRKVHSRDRDGK